MVTKAIFIISTLLLTPYALAEGKPSELKCSAGGEIVKIGNEIGCRMISDKTSFWVGVVFNLDQKLDFQNSWITNEIKIWNYKGHTLPIPSPISLEAKIKMGVLGYRTYNNRGQYDGPFFVASGNNNDTLRDTFEQGIYKNGKQIGIGRKFDKTDSGQLVETKTYYHDDKGNRRETYSSDVLVDRNSQHGNIQISERFDSDTGNLIAKTLTTRSENVIVRIEEFSYNPVSKKLRSRCVLDRVPEQGRFHGYSTYYDSELTGNMVMYNELRGTISDEFGHVNTTEAVSTSLLNPLSKNTIFSFKWDSGEGNITPHNAGDSYWSVRFRLNSLRTDQDYDSEYKQDVLRSMVDITGASGTGYCTAPSIEPYKKFLELLRYPKLDD